VFLSGTPCPKQVHFQELLNPCRDVPSLQEAGVEAPAGSQPSLLAEVTVVVTKPFTGKALVDEVCPEMLKSLQFVGPSWLCSANSLADRVWCSHLLQEVGEQEDVNHNPQPP